MRFLGRSLAALFLVATTLALLAWAGVIVVRALEERAARDGARPPARERVLAVNTVVAAPATVRPTLTAFGEIRALRTLQLRAPVGGRVVALADGFQDGGRVEAGDVLLRIDPAGAEAALAVARADLAGAEAEVRDAERGLDLARAELDGADARRDLQAQALQRQRDLVARGIGAAANVEAAELTLSSAEQTVLAQRRALADAEARVDGAALALERVRIAVDEATRDLSDREVVAGFAGQLSETSVLEGGLVSANEQVATLIDPEALEVAFRLSTAQYARLRRDGEGIAGAAIRAVLDVSGLELVADGTISREAPAVGEGQTGRLVFARLSRAPGFRPGDFVRVEVEEPPLADAISLPATALSAQTTVLALDAGDRLEEVEVELLRRQGDGVLVTGPIAGREVVAERTAALGAGILVRAIGEAGTPEGGPDAGAMIRLDPERRARLVALVEDNARMPGDVKARLLAQLEAEEVPADMVARLEDRAGG